MNLLGRQWHAHESENLAHIHDGPEADLSRYDLMRGPEAPGAQRHAAAALNRLEPEYMPHAFEVHKQIEERGEFFKRHAHTRLRMADYLLDVSAATHNPEYTQLSKRLREARHSFTWGINYSAEWLGENHIEPRLQWDSKAGLPKLCPDDARDDARRIWRIFSPRIWHEINVNGCELHYAVFSPPNWPRTEDMRANIDAGFAEIHDRVMYAGGKNWRNPKRRLAWLRGMLNVLEDPLSERGDWNGHFNGFLITEPRPDYGELREVYGHHLHIEPVGTHGRPTLAEFESVFKELVKYPLQSIPAKSIDKADAGETRAPAATEYPFDAFDQWWQAHKGLRRVREYGCLYYSKRRIREVAAEAEAAGTAEPDELELDAGATWLGRGRCSPSLFSVEIPLGFHADSENLSPCIKITAGEPATGPPNGVRPSWRAPGPAPARRQPDGLEFW